MTASRWLSVSISSLMICRALAQGRDAQIDHVQAVEKVFAEGAVLDRLGVYPPQEILLHLDRIDAARIPERARDLDRVVAAARAKVCYEHSGLDSQAL